MVDVALEMMAPLIETSAARPAEGPPRMSTLAANETTVVRNCVM